MSGDGKAGETRTVEYLAPGVAPDPYQGKPSLDPELEKARDEEVKALKDVPSGITREEPTIDPKLVKIRDEQIKRERERAGVSTSDTPSKESDSAPAKKAAVKKSAKK